MRAAIYARRSTEEHQEESLDTQLDSAKRFIEEQGWTLEEQNIFIDDAVSRAEFKKRPGLIALLNAAKHEQFDILVTRDESRIGGDMIRTTLAIQDLVDAGVRVFYYYGGDEVSLSSATDRMMVSMRAGFAEMEREKISQRTYENLRWKAEKGLVTGGRCFGYDNVKNPDTGKTEYRVNEEQAEVIREIFRRAKIAELNVPGLLLAV